MHCFKTSTGDSFGRVMLMYRIKKRLSPSGHSQPNDGPASKICADRLKHRLEDKPHLLQKMHATRSLWNGQRDGHNAQEGTIKHIDQKLASPAKKYQADSTPRFKLFSPSLKIRVRQINNAVTITVKKPNKSTTISGAGVSGRTGIGGGAIN